jgi:hypothetical protein
MAEMTTYDDPRLDPSAYPLIVYVHVPKTAGSTIKTILNFCTARGHPYIEEVFGDRATILNFARNSDWIAGHVQRDSLATSLIWLDRPVEYFASVREPVAQLVSNLNFSFQRYSLSNYNVEVSRDQQQIDADVMSTDFANPAAVMDLLFRRADLYLNLQSRFVLGGDFAEIADDEIARRLATYIYVASEDDLLKLYRTFGFAQLPEGIEQIRENVAKPHINAQVFDSPQLREFLAYNHKHDLRLYAAVRGASWPAAGRRPFRPTWLRVTLITSENFDEKTYLECNPDVATAVEKGHFESGRAHFDLHGHSENRMMRRWVLPPAAVSRQRSTTTEFSGSEVLERLRRLREECARIATELHSRRAEPAELSRSERGSISRPSPTY